jgi:hypothetical protein
MAKVKRGGRCGQGFRRRSRQNSEAESAVTFGILANSATRQVRSPAARLFRETAARCQKTKTTSPVAPGQAVLFVRFERPTGRSRDSRRAHKLTWRNRSSGRRRHNHSSLRNRCFRSKSDGSKRGASAGTHGDGSNRRSSTHSRTKEQRHNRNSIRSHNRDGGDGSGDVRNRSSTHSRTKERHNSSTQRHSRNHHRRS